MFSIEGKLYRIGMLMYRLVVLNFLFLLFCIPIVTIPASLAALYAVARRHVYQEEPPMFFEFWSSFRENFKQATAVGASFVIFTLLWWFDIRILDRAHVVFAGIIVIVLFLLAAIVLSTFIHIFPLMVHMELSTKQLFSNAIKFVMIKPLLTLVNLVFLCGILYVSGFIPILFLACFFSILATTTYWIVDKKFKFVMIMQGRVPFHVKNPKNAHRAIG